MLFEPGLPTQPVAFSHDPPVDDRLTLVVVAGARLPRQRPSNSWADAFDWESGF